MWFLLIVVTVLFVLPMFASGFAVLSGNPGAVAWLRRLGIGPQRRRQIGTIDLLGCLGLLAALVVPYLGIIVSLCWVGYWVAAIAVHARHGDRIEQTLAPMGFLVASLLLLGLHLMS